MIGIRCNVDYCIYKYPELFEGLFMKTIQMTLDDELVAAVDDAVKKLNTNRSAFARKALRDAIKQLNIDQLEKKHRQGYKRYPVGKTEFGVWESEQEWGD